MAAPDDLLYEFAIIRYVPRIDREEFMNIGLIMMNKRKKWLKALVIVDEERLKAFYPKADIECIKNQSRLFERKDVPDPELPVEEKYRWLTAAKSACLQVSPSHPGLVVMENYKDQNVGSIMDEEFDRLFSSLVMI